MYYGTYHRNLDPKGRLLIPSKLLSEGTKEVFVVRGHEGCLAIYDPESFQAYVGAFARMDFESDPETRAKMRMLASSIHPTPVDKIGRVLLGKQLLSDYAIGEEVTLIGVFDHLEVWDAQAYARYALANGIAYDAPKRNRSAS
ncbi:MAG: hypothetical protein K6E59_01605 [Bacilli bacterium]|nr:hypothetical protein [Bacilli bacterium]